MVETDQEKSEEDRFNETLKRMLKTPPKPHDAPQKEKRQAEARRPPLEQPPHKKGE